MKKKFLDLGWQPLANGFKNSPSDAEYVYPLEVEFDTETCLVSLSQTPPMNLMFNEKYPYYPSQSLTMCEHFRNIAHQILSHMPWWSSRKNKVLEIGSSDGVFMRNFHPSQIVGVEPCRNFYENTLKLGYYTINKFWNMETAQFIKDTIGTFSTIYSANCMCHISNIDEAFKAISHILEPDGTFIFEDPSLLEVIKNDSYDQFYDEHAHIFSLIALNKLLKKTELNITKVEKLNTHGGSNRVYAKKNYPFNKADTIEEKTYKLDQIDTYYYFSDRVLQSRLELQNLLSSKKCIGYGATSKLTTILNYCNLDKNNIDCVTDTTPVKQGKYMPGTNIPIVDPNNGILNATDFAFLGAWNYRDEIMAKERHRKLRFITHVPKVRIL